MFLLIKIEAALMYVMLFTLFFIVIACIFIVTADVIVVKFIFFLIGDICFEINKNCTHRVKRCMHMKSLQNVSREMLCIYNTIPVSVRSLSGILC